MPALLLWALLLLLAVPTLALAETEAPAPPSGSTALLDDGTTGSPVENYGTMPNGEQEIEFEAATTPVSPAPSGSVETPVTPAPADPGTTPAPVDPNPTTPVGEEPATPPSGPVGETPVDETPVDEPVGSVIDLSPDQLPNDGAIYTPPVTAFPPVEIPVAAADPLPTVVIPTDLASYSEIQVPPAEAAVPPASAPASPIVRPAEPVTRAVTTIPSLPTPAHPALSPKPESQFATGPDLVRAAPPMVPAATPVRREADFTAPGVGFDDFAKNQFLPSIQSPTGPAPSGPQLFQVLAQFVMAGGNGPPTGVALLLLVQIATVIGAFAWRTPRSMFQTLMGVSNELFVGYRAVALRPG